MNLKTIAAVAFSAFAVTPAHAGMFRFVPTVPTLDEGGLIALIALVGVVGGLVARRRKK